MASALQEEVQGEVEHAMLQAAAAQRELLEAAAATGQTLEVTAATEFHMSALAPPGHDSGSRPLADVFATFETEPLVIEGVEDSATDNKAACRCLCHIRDRASCNR